MFAVIETGGKQYVVEPGQTLKIEKVEAEPGAEIAFDRVLLTGDDKGGVTIGAPFLTNAKVTATVEEQGRSKKLRVVKFKRKVRYKRVHGHRQDFTKVTIKSIA